jgi:hypothetical protein
MPHNQLVGWMALHPSTAGVHTAMGEENSVFHPTALHKVARMQSGALNTDSRIASGLRGMHD